MARDNAQGTRMLRASRVRADAPAPSKVDSTFQPGAVGHREGGMCVFFLFLFWWVFGLDVGKKMEVE